MVVHYTRLLHSKIVAFKSDKDYLIFLSSHPPTHTTLPHPSLALC